MTRVLIFGVSGLLGINLALEATQKYEVVGTFHENQLLNAGFQTLKVDLSDFGSISSVLIHVKPDWLINCAALTSLDACEQQPKLAHLMNADLPGRLVTEIAKLGLAKRFLYISTDAVFDGLKGDYDETDSPAPSSVYGRTKRLGELAVKAVLPSSLIVRANFFGWSMSGQRSLAEFFVNNLSEGRKVPGFTDRIFCPLLVNDVATILLEMLEKNLSGIYHVGSSDHMSKFDFGAALAKRFGLDVSLIEPTQTTDTVAPRALNLTLRTNRLVKALGRRPPTIAEGIDRLYELHRSGYRARLRAMVPLAEAVKG